MADEGMDPCECVLGHEMAMRRLLSLLRQSQSVCNDSECYEDLSTLSGLPGIPENNMILMMMLWFAFIMVMFLLRPRSIGPKSEGGYRNNEGDDGRPPAPAVN